MPWTEQLSQQVLEEFAAFDRDLDVMQAVAWAKYLARKRRNSRAYRDKHRLAKLESEERRCPVCGRLFPVVLGYRKGRVREYCGPRCRKIAEHRRARARQSGGV